MNDQLTMDFSTTESKPNTKASMIVKLAENRGKVYELQENSRTLAEQIIASGSMLDDDKFWPILSLLTDNVEVAIKNYGEGSGVKSGIHNFFLEEELRVNDETNGNCYTPGDLNSDLMVDFIFTYKKKVNLIANNDDLWEHASNYDSFSDDGWYDFTDSLPLAGREAYEHVLNEVLSDHEVYHKHTEYYVRSTLTKMFMRHARPI
jgi:hypothetical protein